MKKAIAALSAAGLAIGIVSTFGATAVTASVRPHGTPPPVFAVTLVKSTGYSTTATKDTIKIDYSGATHKDALLFGVCNDDASQTSPLISLTDACTSPKELLASKTGAGSATVTFTPGQIGSDSLSSCPQTTGQYGLGIACIVAAEDISASQVSDAPFYFKPKAGRAAGRHGDATLSVKGGYATDGLYGATEATLATGCQAFSATAPAASWSGLPLCDDGVDVPAALGGPLPEGYGFATGEPVEVWDGPYGTGTLVCNPALLPGATGACPYSDADAGAPVTTPGGVSVNLETAFGITLADSTTTTFTLVGAGSAVSVTITVVVSATGKVT
jgi:hypothetical protein